MIGGRGGSIVNRAITSMSNNNMGNSVSNMLLSSSSMISGKNLTAIGGSNNKIKDIEVKLQNRLDELA